MQTIKQEAEKQGLKDITFVSLTFDPKRDTPSILRQFAGVRGIDLKGWDFLTGTQEVSIR
jgi:protein SCO1/2